MVACSSLIVTGDGWYGAKSRLIPLTFHVLVLTHYCRMQASPRRSLPHHRPLYPHQRPTRTSTSHQVQSYPVGTSRPPLQELFEISLSSNTTIHNFIIMYNILSSFLRRLVRRLVQTLVLYTPYHSTQIATSLRNCHRSAVHRAKIRIVVKDFLSVGTLMGVVNSICLR